MLPPPWVYTLDTVLVNIVVSRAAEVDILFGLLADIV
jgi:hypothetical protein